MENEDKWTLLASIMPNGIDVKETSEGECEIEIYNYNVCIRK